MSRSRRIALLVGLVALLAAGLTWDVVAAPPPVAGSSTAAAAGPAGTAGSGAAGPAAVSPPDLPSLPVPGTLAATWFCPAATAVDNGTADMRIVVANQGDTDLSGLVTFTPSEGGPKQLPVKVPPRSRATIRAGDTTPAQFAAALVQLDGSSGAVEEQAVGGLGEADAPCATRASDHWYFAAGTTDRDAQLLISMYNPFPGDAVVDFNFATDTGATTPGDLQGLVVPARGLTVVNIGEHVRRRKLVSTAVSVRTGAVVAAKLQLRGINGTSPRSITLTMGAPAPGSVWYFPSGSSGNGIDEQYQLYNPGDRDADVQVGLSLDRGSADPFTVTVPAHGDLSLAVNGESRIPPGIGHAGVVRVTGGVPIVAERLLTFAPPAPRSGQSDLLGSPRPSPRWLFAAGAANDAQQEDIVAFNPGPQATTVSVTALQLGQPAPVAGLQGVPLQPGERKVFTLGDHDVKGGLIALVEANAGVVVERDLFRIGANGASAALGIPAPA